MDIFQRREIPAPGADGDRIDFSRDEFFRSTGVDEDGSMRVNDHRAARIDKLRIGPGAINADDISKILDGARLEQRHPMLFAFVRPTRDDHEHFRAVAHSGAKDFRKTKVVADERDDFDAVPVEAFDGFAAGIVVQFATKAEGMNLGVANDFLSFWRNGQRFIQSTPIKASAYNSTDNENLEVGGDIFKKLLGPGRDLLGDPGDIHAEPGGEHLREDDETTRFGAILFEQGASALEVLGLFFPGDIELAAINFHSCGGVSSRRTIA